MVVAGGYNSSTVTSMAVSDISGFLRYNAGLAQWEVLLTNNDTVEANFTTSPPVFGGTITLNHVVGSDSSVQLTPGGLIYDVATTNIGNGLVEIAFISRATGLVETTPDANMQVSFRRKALIKSTYPSGLRVLIRRGNVPVNVSRYSTVAGSNMWGIGIGKGR